jgi:ATP-dependent helicase HrpB
MHHLVAHTAPEIVSADLAPLALDLAAAGVSDPLELQWLDPPSPAAFARARELLGDLDAIDAAGRITSRGQSMSALPTHPRLAHMLLHAKGTDARTLASQVAALLSERDIFRMTSGGPPIDADVSLRIDALRGAAAAVPSGAELDRDALRRVRAEADRLARQLEDVPRVGGEAQSSHTRSSATLGALLALAYPDRVAQRRPGERARYLLRNGRGAELTGAQLLATSPYIVAVELDDRRPESRIFLAAAIDLVDIRALFAAHIVAEDIVEFDDAASAVFARRRERLGAIVLRDIALKDPSESQVRAALLGAIRRRGLDALPWPPGARAYRDRIAFVAAHDPTWPDVSDVALAERLDEWLGPLLGNVRSFAELETLPLTNALSNLLNWRQRQALDELAPSHIEVPTGSRLSVDYSDPAAPSLAVRIQEVFGLTESPRVLGGRVPITMQLLSPAHRPVQVTRDLAGFWRTSYFDVRRDLRGRYPKHEWPEDPVNATPTRRAKPRGR